MDTLLTLLAAAGVDFVMGVPGADDVMLGYQSSRSTTRSTCASCWACGRRRSSRPGCAGLGMTDARAGFFRSTSTTSPLRHWTAG